MVRNEQNFEEFFASKRSASMRVENEQSYE